LSLCSRTRGKVGFCFPFEKALYPSALEDFWKVASSVAKQEPNPSCLTPQLTPYSEACQLNQPCYT